MTHRPKNLAASIRQRLLNESKRRGESLDYLMSLYARERFLVRLDASGHRDELVLKGATALTFWLEGRHRTTRDLDFLGIGDFDEESAARMIAAICDAEVAADGLIFLTKTIRVEPIREANEYHGVRVLFDADLAMARIRMQVDIGVGDVVTPRAKLTELPTLLEELVSPKLRVYPPETMIAEKLQAIVKLGIANSRTKDYFDLDALARSREFDGAILLDAVKRTFRRRRTALPTITPVGLSEEFFTDSQKVTQWRAFLKKSALSTVEFSEVGARLRAFLLPLLAAGASNEVIGTWRDPEWH